MEVRLGLRALIALVIVVVCWTLWSIPLFEQAAVSSSGSDTYTVRASGSDTGPAPCPPCKQCPRPAACPARVSGGARGSSSSSSSSSSGSSGSSGSSSSSAREEVRDEVTLPVQCVEKAGGAPGSAWEYECGWEPWMEEDCAISVGMVSEGAKFTELGFGVIKSLLWHRSTPIEVFVATRGSSIEDWKAKVRGLTVPGLRVRVYDLASIDGHQVFSLPCDHYSCPSTLTQAVLHEVFSTARKIIVLGCDYTVIGDLVEAWAVFDSFGEDTLFAAAEQTTHWYDEPGHVWGPLEGTNGVQTPQLLHLERMRDIGFTKMMMDAYHKTAKETGHTNLELGDMDLSNNFAVVHPSYVLVLKFLRTINLEYCATLMDLPRVANFAGTTGLGINAIHWNCAGLFPNPENAHLGQDIRELTFALSKMDSFWISQRNVHLQCWRRVARHHARFEA